MDIGDGKKRERENLREKGERRKRGGRERLEEAHKSQHLPAWRFFIWTRKEREIVCVCVRVCVCVCVSCVCLVCQERARE